jgi:hypothetical protein
MQQFGGKYSKRHFTVVMGNKEHGLYVSSTPSSAAKKAVTKLCASNKSKKVQFEIREITQGSKKKTYGPYEGYIEKLKEPIELKGRVIRYKPVAKLSGEVGKKSNVKKGEMRGGQETTLERLRRAKLENIANEINSLYSNGKSDGTKILELKEKLALCEKNLGIKQQALERSAEELGKNWSVL